MRDSKTMICKSSLLPVNEIIEIAEAIQGDQREPSTRHLRNWEFFICGKVNSNKTITLIRGNFEKIIVPFEIFSPSGNGTNPDFEDFEIIDYGQAIRLGKYESGSDSILHILGFIK